MNGFWIHQLMFSIIPIIVVIMFIITIGKLIYTGITTLNDKRKPIIPVEAVVIAKRTAIRGGGQNHHTYTSYFITFELINGERIELKVPNEQFGYLIEGDRGILSFQGKLFVTFKRS